MLELLDGRDVLEVEDYALLVVEKQVGALDDECQVRAMAVMVFLVLEGIVEHHVSFFCFSL